MTDKQINDWLITTVSNVFMNFLYYDRKECELVSEYEMREMMDNGTISKDQMIKVFTDQINKEY